MYNRYIRNDDGVYQRIPHQDGPPPPRHEPHEEPDEGKGFIDKILKKLNLGDIDKGDILLLLILLFLFDQDEDEELLIALGLLFLL